MGQQTIQTVLAQQNLIRHLLNEKFKTDDEIMRDLRLKQTTFYLYKKRIQEEDSKIWDIVHSDSSKFRGVQLLKDLDKTRQECMKISADYNNPPRDRMEALKTACEASANIFKLLNEGLSFTVSIPQDKIKQIVASSSSSEDKPIEEDKPAEDKDLPNEDKKTDTDELIPSGHEPWGTSLQRPSKDYYEQNNKYHKTGIVKAKKQVEPSVSDPVSKSKKYSRL